jgi:hypothetical protein
MLDIKSLAFAANVNVVEVRFLTGFHQKILIPDVEPFR